MRQRNRHSGTLQKGLRKSTPPTATDGPKNRGRSAGTRKSEDASRECAVPDTRRGANIQANVGGVAERTPFHGAEPRSQQGRRDFPCHAPMKARADARADGGWWARLGLNQRPLRCQRSALPLSYAPVADGALYRFRAAIATD